MLADRGILKSVEKQMGNKDFYIEVKYDGERLQVSLNFFEKSRKLAIIPNGKCCHVGSTNFK